jgi:hypothetical protein
MGVKKFYEYAEVKSAIDMANKNYYRKFLRVRNDVANKDWGKPSVKVARDAKGKAIDPMAWQGKGSDTGHAFRHVEDTKESGKSTYQDEFEMVMCAREVLNSKVGQEKLGELDAANPLGDEVGMGENRKIVARIVGCYYGFPTGSSDKKRIKSAVVEVMKLGEGTLWIHSTYPNRFET